MIATSPNLSVRVRPWHMPPMAAADLPSRNVLMQYRQPWQWPWQDRVCTAGLLPSGTLPARPVWQLALEWEGHPLRLVLTDPQQLLSVLWPDDAWPDHIDWPPALWQALFETMQSAWRQAHPSLRSARVRLVSVRHEVPAPSSLLMGWFLSLDGARATGLLAMDAGAAGHLSEQCRTRPTRSVNDWIDLPVPLRMLAGWTDLPQQELACTAPGDVLLVDVCHLGADRQSLVFMVNDRLGVRGRRHPQGWLIDQGVHSVMTPDPHCHPAPTDDPSSLDDIPVRITFDLGDREIPLGELRALMPGYVFNLGHDPSSAVAIRANGRWIGEGELVDIDGRIGVVVHRLQGVDIP